ncbi:hypothetical protein [Halosolutus gelatinilyticus]|uniref:hypothetical protein n=1 Tax=Halosolutus gelatinilyticus TaxID=2931975 RepID=UPI001FF2EF75|nr:hypothetical protein [Halosolutus gelatinilyticus]
MTPSVEASGSAERAIKPVPALDHDRVDRLLRRFDEGALVVLVRDPARRTDDADGALQPIVDDDRRNWLYTAVGQKRTKLLHSCSLWFKRQNLLVVSQ